MKTMILVAMMLGQEEAPAADAPFADMLVQAGETVPFQGYCMESKEFIRREKINVRNDVIATEAQKNYIISMPVLIALVAGAVATGVALTLGGIEVKKAIDKKP